jgi:hypothetical protein
MANEQILLTVPAAQPVLSGYRRGSLQLFVEPAPRIVVTIIRNDTNTGEVFEYPAAGTSLATEAQVLASLVALNTANLSGVHAALWQRIADKLVVDFPARFAGGATVA